MIHLSDVLHKFYPNTEWGIDGNSYAGLHWSKNNKIDKPTEEAIQAQLKELQADYESKQYQRDREYPQIQEQLDMIFWDKKNGTKTWEETIDKIKKDFPKPE